MARVSEIFLQDGSLLHSADPRAKLLCALCLSFSIALLQSLFVACAAFFLMTASAFFFISNKSGLRNRLLMVNVFILFLWVMLPFTYGGEQVVFFDFLSISLPGVRLALLLTLKSNAIVIVLVMMLGSTPAPALGHALHKLHAPKKFAWIFLFTYRYIFVLLEEYERLFRAAKLRCFHPRTDVRTYRAFAYLFAMTLVRGYERAQRVQQAMLLRGFHGKFYSLHEMRMCSFDFFLLCASAALAAGFFILDISLQR